MEKQIYQADHVSDSESVTPKQVKQADHVSDSESVTPSL